MGCWGGFERRLRVGLEVFYFSVDFFFGFGVVAFDGVLDFVERKFFKEFIVKWRNVLLFMWCWLSLSL